MSDLVQIYTYKAGLLSRVAHDLRLHVDGRGVRITRTGEEVSAEFDPTALVVDGAMVTSGSSSRLDPDSLSARDRGKIVDTIRDDILVTRRYPRIRFHGTAVLEKTARPGAERLDIAGELELVGVRRPLRFVAKREGSRLKARVDLRPSDWGIQPYKALAGAIRLEDRVVIELDLDLEYLDRAAASDA